MLRSILKNNQNINRLVVRSTLNLSTKSGLYRSFAFSNQGGGGFNNQNNQSIQQTNQSFNSKQQQELLNNERFYNEEKFVGISQAPFDKEITDVLLGDLNNHDIEIKPDGLIYLPEIKYRRILNLAFGPGGWALKPFGPPVVINGSLIRPYALYCLGRYVAESLGEQPYAENGFLSFATATESAKSNALVRCCKDLGIGSSLWDPIFIRNWKQTYAQEKLYEHSKTNEKRKFWTLKAGPPMSYPWKEVGSFSNNQTSSSSSTFTSSSSSPSTDQQQFEESSINQQQQFNVNQIQSSPSMGLMEDVLPVSGFKSTPRPPQQQQQQDDLPIEEIDIDSIVPPQLKKYAGKTWREIIHDPQGESYLSWAANSLKGRTGLQAKAIHEFIKQAQQDQSDQH